VNRSGLFSFLSLVVALSAIAAFDYAIAQTVAVTLCGNAGPYAHAHPCPRPSAALITAIPFAFMVAVIAGLIAAVRLSPFWAWVVWAAFCVPSGVLLGVLGHMLPHSFALYAVGLMLVLMGIGPAIPRAKTADTVSRSR
jgi:hypothetical protein